MLEGRDPTWRDLDRLQRWAAVNLVEFNMAKRKALHLSWDNPRYQYRLGGGWIKGCSEEKNFGVPVDKKLNMA